MPVRQRHVIGILRRPEALRAVLEALITAGFMPGDMALLGGGETFRTWRLPTDAAGGSVDEVLSRRPMGLATESKAGRLLASGGIFDCLIGGEAAAMSWPDVVRWGFSGRHADAIVRRIDSGALALWVGVADSERERLASLLLLRHGDGPVQIHDLTIPFPPRSNAMSLQVE